MIIILTSGKRNKIDVRTKDFYIDFQDLCIVEQVLDYSIDGNKLLGGLSKNIFELPRPIDTRYAIYNLVMDLSEPGFYSNKLTFKLHTLHYY